MVEKAMDVISKAYENFFMRDLTYVFAGSLLLFSIKYAYDGHLKVLIDYITHDIFKFLTFMFYSYFIGLVIQEAASFLGIVKTRANVPKPFTDYSLLTNYIRKQYGLGVIMELERIIYLKHIGAAIGSTSLVSSFFLLPLLIKNHRSVDFIIFFALIIIAIICLKENRWKLKQQNQTLEHLANTAIARTQKRKGEER